MMMHCTVPMDYGASRLDKHHFSPLSRMKRAETFCCWAALTLPAPFCCSANTRYKPLKTDTLQNVARLHQKQGRLADAEAMRIDVLHIRDLKLGHESLHVACNSSTGHSALRLSLESAAVGGENSFRASFCSDERELPSGICTWKCKYMSPKLLRSSCCTPMPLSTCCDLVRTNPNQVDALNLHLFVINA